MNFSFKLITTKTPTYKYTTIKQSKNHFSSQKKTYEWNFLRFLPNFEPPKADKKITSILVNYEVPSYIDNIWKASNPRICCDGGVHRLIKARPNLIESHPPTKVIGDLDSMNENDFPPIIKEKKIAIEHNPDQNSNDLEKALRDFQRNFPDISHNENQIICVFGGIGGNLSQVFANIHSLFLFPHLEIYLLSEENISVLLKDGFNRIHVKEDVPCSFVPFNEPVVASSAADHLAYPLQNTQLKFGKLISTSNKTTKNIVEVHVSAPCLFTLDLHPTEKFHNPTNHSEPFSQKEQIKK